MNKSLKGIMKYICIACIGIIDMSMHTYINELENLYFTNCFYPSQVK